MSKETELSIADIYSQLILSESNELHLEMSPMEFPRMKNALIKYKTNQNKKLKEANLETDIGTLEFEANAVKDKTNLVKVVIRLKYPITFKVASITSPANDF